jgi:hypothetical protein
MSTRGSFSGSGLRPVGFGPRVLTHLLAFRRRRRRLRLAGEHLQHRHRQLVAAAGEPLALLPDDAALELAA